MEKPDAATTAWYEAALPDDPRVQRGQMFGHPCAFVHGNMFFGTFGQGVIARVGAAEAAARVGGPLSIFAPREGRAWKEYLHVASGALPDGDLRALAAEALAHTAGLPPKAAQKSVAPARTRARGKRG